MLKVSLMASAAAVALSLPALAADTDESRRAEVPAAQSDAVGELLVTAQRREQAAQDVGIALSAFTGEALAEKGVSQVNALENLTPSLEVESQFGSGQPVFAIRGVGFRDYATNNSPTVGIYVDEVNYPYPVMTQGVLFDVERVEVLRGPQGTLYGRNTTGGAINIVSRRPTDEFEAGLTLEYGRFEAFSAEGFVSGPIASSKVRGRLAAITENGGAWQKNRETGAELGEADRYAVRGLLQVDLEENLELLINLHGYKDESDGLGLQLFQPFGTFAAHQGQRETSFGMTSEFASVTGLQPDEKPFRDNVGFGGSLALTGDMGFGTLTYIGAYESLDRREYNDYDALPISIAGVFFTSDIESVSHELRIASNGDERLDWIVGLFYGDEQLDENYQSDFADSFGPFFASIYSPAPGTPFAVRTPYQQKAETLGIFGQVEFEINRQVNLVGGLRYEDESRELNDLGTFITFSNLNQATCTNFTVPATCSSDLIDRDTGMNEVTGKVGVEYTPSDDVLLYGSVSRGVKSGGFTAYNTLNPAGADPFEPEELWAYEVGIKSDLFTRALRLNGAVFYYDYENQQIQSAIAPGGIVIGRIVNAPSSTIWGGEAELLWSPLTGLSIGQSIGYKEGEFDEFDDLDTTTLGTIDRSGQAIGFPELSYSGTFNYTGPLPNTELDWSASFDYNYRDDQQFPLLGNSYSLESYWLANARLAIGSQNRKWEIAIWGRNIFDQDYEEQRNFFAAPDVTPIAAPGMPATYGAQLSVSF